MDFLAGYGWLAHGRLHMLTALPAILPQELWAVHHSEITTAIAALFVGIVVGITGMGGGALMTPALIFLGVGNPAVIVTADLTAAAIYKTGGAIVHAREGSPQLALAKWLVLGSVPMALLGPYLVAGLTEDEDQLHHVLMMAIGVALLFAASTYALRLYLNLRRVRGG